MNKEVKPQSSSIFAYGYCLLFFFLVSFDISNAQTATTDPSEGVFGEPINVSLIAAVEEDGPTQLSVLMWKIWELGEAEVVELLRKVLGFVS